MMKLIVRFLGVQLSRLRQILPGNICGPPYRSPVSTVPRLSAKARFRCKASAAYGGVCQWVVFSSRNRHFFALDILILALIPVVALSLRLERLDWWPQYDRALLLFIAISMPLTLAIFHRLGVYRHYWSFAGVTELLWLVVAVNVATLVLVVIFGLLQPVMARYGLTIPRTLPLIDGLLTGLAVVGVRFGVRGMYHLRQREGRVIGGRRVLIVGAGEAGTMVAREMRANPSLNMEPVLFVENDLHKVGTRIQGIPVCDESHGIPRLVKQFDVQRIVLAVPSAPLKRQQELMAICRKTGLVTHNLPGVYELLAGYKTVQALPKLDLNQLLHRKPIVTDASEVAASLANTSVLVTGAGGSIGRELCRQVARCEPREIILLGHGENSVFEICLDLRLSYPHLTIQPVIVDVRDQPGVNCAVHKYRPDIIFHAAAHKHVPLMESHVTEAITNNVLGTHNMLCAAEKYGVERFIQISSDKAVHPTSIMGTTKRLAELLVIAAARRSGQAYVAVRFGNVLGSRGSVLRVFEQQILAGGPLTVTHPDMCRYFMTIPEAVQLVLQAGVLGQGGEVFVLDMGEQIRILDMATQLIKMCGLQLGRDIDIVYSGIRPGEKLYEELFLTSEHYQRTKHAQIFVASPDECLQTEALEQVVLELINLARQMQRQHCPDQIRRVLTQVCYYLDEYQPQTRPDRPAPIGHLGPGSSPSSPLRPSSSPAGV